MRRDSTFHVCCRYRTRLFHLPVEHAGHVTQGKRAESREGNPVPACSRCKQRCSGDHLGNREIVKRRCWSVDASHQVDTWGNAHASPTRYSSRRGAHHRRGRCPGRDWSDCSKLTCKWREQCVLCHDHWQRSHMNLQRHATLCPSCGRLHSDCSDARYHIEHRRAILRPP